MVMRASTDPYATTAGLVDRQLGTAYETVKKVSEIAEELKYVAHNMEAVTGAAQVPAQVPGIVAGVVTTATADAAATINPLVSGAQTAAGQADAAKNTAISRAEAAAVSAAQAEVVVEIVRVVVNNNPGFALVNGYGEALAVVTATQLLTLAGNITRLEDGTMSLSRPDGSVALDLTAEGVRLPQAGTTFVGRSTPKGGLAICNAYGEALLNIDPDGSFIGGLTVRQTNGVLELLDTKGAVLLSSNSSAAGAFSTTEIQQRDALNRVAGADYVAQGDTEVTSLTGLDYLATQRGGQSNGRGDQGNPPLTRTAMPGVEMLGEAVWCNSPTGATAAPYGSAVFTPAIARGMSGSTLLTYPEVDLLTPGTAFGEEGSLAAARMFRRMLEDHRGAGPKIVPANLAVSGRAIEEFLPSPPGGVEVFNRFTSYASATKGAANALGKTIALGWIEWLGHEYNYTNPGGTFDTTRVGLKAKLNQLRQRFLDSVMPIFGNSRIPAFITYQTGGPWTRVNAEGELGMGMAQLEFAEENRGCYLACPYYSARNYVNHADNTGHRLIGAQIGKVAWNVIGLRQNWRPLMPVSLVWRGNEVLVLFHVPRGNLVFDAPPGTGTPVDLPYKGFHLVDNTGTLPILPPEIVGSSVVRLTMTRPPNGPLKLRLGGLFDQTGNVGGYICLRDQDTTRHPDFSDPLYNWCVAGQWPVQAA